MNSRFVTHNQTQEKANLKTEALSRRKLLETASLLCVNGLFSTPSFASAQSVKGMLLSTVKNNNQEHELVALNHLGTVIFRSELPDRAHGVAVSSDKRVGAVFARRHGEYLSIFNTTKLKKSFKVAEFRPPEDCAFNGHGCFSEDGTELYVSENLFSKGIGRISVYRFEEKSEKWTRFTSWKSQGVGCHELLCIGETLIVANGGVQTHPDTGRTKLNLKTMKPNLAVLNRSTGAVISVLRLPDHFHQLSIRHLSANQNGQIVLGLQYFGKAKSSHPVGAFLDSKTGQIKFLTARASIWESLKNYAGSVCFDASGRFVALTSPKGGCVQVWQIKNGEFHHKAHWGAKDVCGIVAGSGKGAFLATTGNGEVLKLDSLAGSFSTVAKHPVSFDNHAISL